MTSLSVLPYNALSAAIGASLGGPSNSFASSGDSSGGFPFGGLLQSGLGLGSSLLGGLLGGNAIDNENNARNRVANLTNILSGLFDPQAALGSGFVDQTTFNALPQDLIGAGGFRGQALGALGDLQGTFGGLQQLLGGAEQQRLGDLASGFQNFLGASQQARNQQLGQFDQGTSAIQGLIDQATSGFQQSARAANQRTFDDTVRLQSQRLADSLSGRGLGSSSLLESGVASAIVPNALGGLLSANSAVDQAASQARLGGAGILGNRLAQRESVLGQSLGDELARRFGVFQQQAVGLPETFLNRQIGAITTPAQFTASALAQPGAIYPQLASRLSLPAAPSVFAAQGGQGIGNILTGTGLVLQGGGLTSLFSPRLSNASGLL